MLAPTMNCVYARNGCLCVSRPYISVMRKQTSNGCRFRRFPFQLVQSEVMLLWTVTKMLLAPPNRISVTLNAYISVSSPNVYWSSESHFPMCAAAAGLWLLPASGIKSHVSPKFVTKAEVPTGAKRNLCRRDSGFLFASWPNVYSALEHWLSMCVTFVGLWLLPESDRFTTVQFGYASSIGRMLLQTLFVVVKLF